MEDENKQWIEGKEKLGALTKEWIEITRKSEELSETVKEKREYIKKLQADIYEIERHRDAITRICKEVGSKYEKHGDNHTTNSNKNSSDVDQVEKLDVFCANPISIVEEKNEEDESSSESESSKVYSENEEDICENKMSLNSDSSKILAETEDNASNNDSDFMLNLDFKILDLAFDPVNKCVLAICDDENYRLFKENDKDCVKRILSQRYGTLFGLESWSIPKNLGKSHNNQAFVVYSEKKVQFLHPESLEDIFPNSTVFQDEVIKAGNQPIQGFEGNVLFKKSLFTSNDPRSLSYLIYVRGLFLLYSPKLVNKMRVSCIPYADEIKDFLRNEVVLSGFIYDSDEICIFTKFENVYKVSIFNSKGTDADTLKYTPLKGFFGVPVLQGLPIPIKLEKERRIDLYVYCENGKIIIKHPPGVNIIENSPVIDIFTKTCSILDMSFEKLSSQKQFLIGFGTSTNAPCLNKKVVVLIPINEMWSSSAEVLRIELEDAFQTNSEQLPFALEEGTGTLVYANNTGGISWIPYP